MFNVYDLMWDLNVATLVATVDAAGLEAFIAEHYMDAEDIHSQLAAYGDAFGDVYKIVPVA